MNESKFEKMKMRSRILWAFLALISITASFTACDDDDDDFNPYRDGYVFTPTDFYATVSDENLVTFNWSDRANTDADHYLVEIYSPSISSSFLDTAFQVELGASPLTYNVELYSGLEYEARIRGVAGNENVENSEWAVTSYQAHVRDIIGTGGVSQISGTGATFTWTPGAQADNLVIYDSDNSLVMQEAISAEEVAAGSKSVDGLTPSVEYTAQLVRGPGVVGEYSFTTLFEGGIPVANDSELAEAVANASDGDILILAQGNYTLTDANPIATQITIRGMDETSMPTVKMHITLPDANRGITLQYLNLDGGNEVSSLISYDEFSQGCSPDYFQSWTNAGGTLFSIPCGTTTISNCHIQNYSGSMIYLPGQSYQMVEGIVIDDCVITNIAQSLVDLRHWNEAGACSGAGGDGSGNPYRGSSIANLTVTNSTIYNSSTGRGILRIDDTSISNPDCSLAVTFTNNTLDHVSDGANYLMRISYSRAVDTHVNQISSCIFTNINVSYWNRSNRFSGDYVDFDNNFYSNSDNLLTNSGRNDALYDPAGTTTDPQYSDPTNGDFTVGAPNVNAGDPRWLN